jgi:NIMA (never in mitosis gene a)-related kinase
LESLIHPNIVKYVESFFDEDDFIIVMEYIDGKTLRTLIPEQKAKYRILFEEYVCQIFYQIVSALSYCHSLNIIQGDLKPENILITNENQVKLIDFGLSKLIKTISKGMYTQAGTQVYMNPELIKEEKYYSSADIWSLGCVLFELIALTHPFSYKVFHYITLIFHKRFLILPLLIAQNNSKNLFSKCFVMIPKIEFQYQKLKILFLILNLMRKFQLPILKISNPIYQKMNHLK